MHNRPTMKRLITLMSLALIAGCGDQTANDAEIASQRPGGEAQEGADGKADTTVGPVTAMRCSAQSSYVRKGGYVEVDVDARDAEQQLSRNYALTVTPSADTRVIQRNKIIFDGEGAYEIACCALDTGLCDHTAVQVGQLYPALSVTAPRWLDGPQTARLEGRALDHTGKAASVKVEGQRVRVDADGRFTVSLPARSGVNTYTLVATDAEGRSSTRFAWVMAGPFGDLDRPEADGVVVALGDEAYPQLSDLIRRGLDLALQAESFYAGIMRSKEGTEGVYKWKMKPVGIGITDVKVDLEPHPAGLQVNAALERITFTAELETKLGFFGWKKREATARLARLAASAVANVRDGQITLADLSVELTDLDLEISDLPGFVEDLLLYFFEDDLAKTLETQLQRQIDKKLASALDGFAKELPLELPEPLHGDLVATTRVSTIHGDAAGLMVGLALTVDGETDPLRLDAPGPWRGAAAAARPSRDAMYEAALSVDLLNTLFFAAWQTGALDLSFSQEEVRTNPDVPGVIRVDYFIDPRMPPVVYAGDNPGIFNLALPAIQLDVVMETSLGFVNASAAVGGEMAIAFKAEGDAVAVDVTPLDITLDLQVAPADLEREAVRRYLAGLVETKIFPKLARLSRVVPVPEADLTDLGLEGVSRLTVRDLDIGAGQSPDVLRVSGRAVIE